MLLCYGSSPTDIVGGGDQLYTLKLCPVGEQVEVPEAGVFH